MIGLELVHSPRPGPSLKRVTGLLEVTDPASFLIKCARMRPAALIVGKAVIGSGTVARVVALQVLSVL